MQPDQIFVILIGIVLFAIILNDTRIIITQCSKKNQQHMKTVILQQPQEKTVLIENLTGNEFVAYRSKTSQPGRVEYCVLVRLNPGTIPPDSTRAINSSCGFMCIGDVGSKLRFATSSYQESIRLAAKSRDVKVFDTQEELIMAMYHKAF